MQRKHRTIFFGAVLLFLTIIAVIITMLEPHWTPDEKGENATPVPLSSESVKEQERLPGSRPEYPRWEDITHTEGTPVSSEVYPVIWPGEEDLDDNGQPLPPYAVLSPVVVPIFQNESETGI